MRISQMNKKKNHQIELEDNEIIVEVYNKFNHENLCERGDYTFICSPGLLNNFS